MGGGRGGGGKGKKERRKSDFLRIGCITTPGAESEFWPALLSREQRGYQKSHRGGDHYVDFLGQTRVSLPAQLISGHRHILIHSSWVKMKLICKLCSMSFVLKV